MCVSTVEETLTQQILHCLLWPAVLELDQLVPAFMRPVFPAFTDTRYTPFHSFRLVHPLRVLFYAFISCICQNSFLLNVACVTKPETYLFLPLPYRNTFRESNEVSCWQKNVPMTATAIPWSLFNDAIQTSWTHQDSCWVTSPAHDHHVLVAQQIDTDLNSDSFSSHLLNHKPYILQATMDAVPFGGPPHQIEYVGDTSTKLGRGNMRTSIPDCFWRILPIQASCLVHFPAHVSVM